MQTINPVKSLNVLLVEDEPITRMVHDSMLREIGLQPDVVFTGEEAIKLFENKHHDIIFMDIELPGMSGLEAARQIRLREKPTKQTHITALTAHRQEEIEDACKQAGISTIKIKPLLTQELKHHIEEVSQIVIETDKNPIKTSKKEELDQIIKQLTGYTAQNLHNLLAECHWNLLNAYAITGREAYRKQVENLGAVLMRLHKQLV